MINRNSESTNASWEIERVSLKDEGFYDCIAISSAGTGRAQTFLDVSGENQIQTEERSEDTVYIVELGCSQTCTFLQMCLFVLAQ